MCRLESTKELLEEEVVCTTFLEHKELNKWSHDQDKSEAEIQQTGSQKAASYQGNSYIRWLVLQLSHENFLNLHRRASPLVKVPFTIIEQLFDFEVGENANSVDHVLPCLNVLFNNTDPYLRLHVTRHHSPQKASTNPLTSSLCFQPLYLHIRIIPPDFDIPLG